MWRKSTFLTKIFSFITRFGYRICVNNIGAGYSHHDVYSLPGAIGYIHHHNECSIEYNFHHTYWKLKMNYLSLRVYDEDYITRLAFIIHIQLSLTRNTIIHGWVSTRVTHYERMPIYTFTNQLPVIRSTYPRHCNIICMFHSWKYFLFYFCQSCVCLFLITLLNICYQLVYRKNNTQFFC